jgi:hypothetical protein
MSFFERPPWRPPPQDPWPPAWLGPPEAVVPGIVPVELLLARTDDHAVLATDLLAYPTGLEFILATRPRPGRPRAPHPRDHVRDHGLFGHRGLRLEIRFADGRVVGNHPPHRPRHLAAEEPDQPMLYQGGGGGGDNGYRLHHWLWGLPPPGPVAFVCEWPARQIPESQTEIDAGLILEAAGRAVPVWPAG